MAGALVIFLVLAVAGVLGGMGYRAGWFSSVFIAQDQPIVSPEDSLEETISLPEPEPSLEDLVVDAKAAYEARNYGNAFALFQQAAEQGSAEAQFRLGTMYLEGRTVAPDTTVAEAWLRRADEQGYANAEQALAHLEKTEADENTAEAVTDETGIPPPPPPDEEAEPYVYFLVDQMPELIGGIRAIQEKIEYPERAYRRGVEGSVTLTFVVDEQGQVVDPVVKERDGLGFDKEALRVVREAQFKPGRHRDRPVKVQQSLTITFKLSQQTPEEQPEAQPDDALEDDQGIGEIEQKTASFVIEGLNRSTIHTPSPRNTESANVAIKVRITVNPQGRVVRIFPVQKGNPSLERAVRDVLLRWRFNALPSDAPQISQTGYVTFRFVDK